jgi:hypothetical protein
MKNIPDSNSTDERLKKQIEVTEKLIWDSFKSKYYFSEKFAI